MSNFNPQFAKIGEVLVHNEIITDDQLSKALSEQKNSKGKLGTILIKLGFISENDLTNAYSQQMGNEIISLDNILKANLEVTSLLPEDFAKEKKVIALNKTDSAIAIAMEDPEDLATLDSIKKLTKLNPEILIASKSDVNEALNILYAKEGLSILQGDAYDLTTEGYINNKYSKEQLRPLLKLMLLIMINAKSYKQAFEAVVADKNDTTKQLAQLSNAELGNLMKVFVQKHKAIKKYFYSGFGASLYLYDSTVAEGVINHFTDKDIPVLCIHDSFIIELKYLEELKKVMRDSFKQTMLSKTAPNINTDDFLTIRYSSNPKHRHSGLFSLIPNKIKPNTLMKLIMPNKEEVTIKKQIKSKEIKDRYSEFKNKRSKEEYHYYNNKK